MRVRHVLPVLLLLLAAALHAQAPVKNILLEEFSTAPCGFCPDGDIIAEQLVKTYPSVIWVTHHAGFGTDSMTVPESRTIAAAFTTFAPGACLNRGDYPIPIYTMQPYIAVSRQRWDSVIVAHLGDSPEATVAVAPQYDAATRTLRCRVDASFLSAPAPGDFRINLFLVEDRVVGSGKGYDQTNYFNGTPGHPFYQKGDPIIGYEHRRVLRAIPSGAWGVSGVLPSAPEAGRTYSHTFDRITISDRWNAGGMDVVAFVSYHDADAKKRQVLNSAIAPMTGGATSVDPPAVPPLRPVITAMPNPAAETVLLRFEPPRNESGRTLKVLDLVGRVVYVADIESGRRVHAVPVHGFPSGLYFTRLIDTDGTLTTGSFSVLR